MFVLKVDRCTCDRTGVKQDENRTSCRRLGTDAVPSAILELMCVGVLSVNNAKSRATNLRTNLASCHHSKRLLLNASVHGFCLFLSRPRCQSRRHPRLGTHKRVFVRLRRDLSVLEVRLFDADEENSQPSDRPYGHLELRA